MGKGDKKTRRGKIAIGSHGVKRRKNIKKRPTTKEKINVDKKG